MLPSQFYNIINHSYSTLRIKIYKLNLQYIEISKYYTKYKNFLNYAKYHYKDLLNIDAIKTHIYVTDDIQKHQQQQKNLPPNTLFSTKSNFYKYLAIKAIVRHIIHYENVILTYLNHLHHSLILLSDGITEFVKLFFLFSQTLKDDDNSPTTAAAAPTTTTTALSTHPTYPTMDQIDKYTNDFVTFDIANYNLDRDFFKTNY